MPESGEGLSPLAKVISFCVQAAVAILVAGIGWFALDALGASKPIAYLVGLGLGPIMSTPIASALGFEYRRSSEGKE
jgi:hypothetical protein